MGSIQQSLNGSGPYLTRHSFLFLFLRLKTGIKHKLQNGKGRRIQESKEAFGIMDCDKNGLLSEDDLVSAFAAVGKSISSGEASNMLSESPGPVNSTQMVTLFAEKMAGGTDDDDTILKSFDAFEINGKIDAEMFKHSLMTWGDKYTDTEVDDAFAEFVIEDGQIDAAHLKSLMVAKKEGEEEA